MKDHAKVRLHGDTGKSLTCAAGHVVGTGWLTRDLPGAMGVITYEILDGRLYRSDGREVHDDLDVRPEGSALVVTRRSHLKAPSHGHTGVVHIYARCRSCRPVVYATRSTTLDALCAMLEMRLPWVEYGLKFFDGKLVEQMAVKMETRSDVVKELREAGVQILDDESHLAKGFLEEISTKDWDIEMLLKGGS